MKKTPAQSAVAKDVDSYLAALPDDVRGMLEKLRKTIKAAAPQAEEVISYRMPAFKYHGPLLFFAAWENHCSLYAVSKALLKTLRSDLERYTISGTTIHFSVDNPLPASLVRKIVKARMKDNELRAEQKQSKR
ncbi:MAG TPA: DUF1801 domain-containing protein [bacterium]|jgi:uncharacterized protein YdhG (YjbR/CyaY superfamily)